MIILITLVGSAQAASLRVVTEEWPPYNYTENGKVTGVVTEAIRAVLDRAGIDYSIESLPWARAYELARTEPNVLIYTILKLPNRVSHFKWVHLEGLSINMALFRPRFRDDITVHSLDDAKKYKIGVKRATSTHHFLLAHGFTEGKNLFPVHCEKLNALKSRPRTQRVDLTTGDRLSLLKCLADAGLPPDYWVEVCPLFKKDLYMAFSPATPDATVRLVSAKLSEIRDEGGLDAVLEKYNGMFQ